MYGRSQLGYVAIENTKYPPPLDLLTTAEAEITLWLLSGRTNKAIASTRGSSVRTVTNQVAAIFRKLGVDCIGSLRRRLNSPTSRPRSP